MSKAKKRQQHNTFRAPPRKKGRVSERERKRVTRNMYIINIQEQANFRQCFSVRYTAVDY